MFDRLVEDFCQFDDFCQAFGPHWQARLLSQGAQPAKKRGPQAGLADSEIMTILVLYHRSNFRHFKAFYEGVVLTLLRSAFPQAPCYASNSNFGLLAWSLTERSRSTRMKRIAQGGTGGGFAKASVSSRSSHEGKIR